MAINGMHKIYIITMQENEEIISELHLYNQYYQHIYFICVHPW